jgi:hypothetical protein
LTQHASSRRKIWLRAWPFLPTIVVIVVGGVWKDAAPLLAIIFFVMPGFLVWTFIGLALSLSCSDRPGAVLNGLGLLLALAILLGGHFHI